MKTACSREIDMENGRSVLVMTINEIDGFTRAVLGLNDVAFAS